MATLRFDQEQFQNFLIMYLFDMVTNNNKYNNTNDVFNIFFRKLSERGLRALTLQAFYDIPSDIRQKFYVVRSILQGASGGMLAIHFIYDKKKHNKKVIKNHMNKAANKVSDKNLLNKVIGV